MNRDTNLRVYPINPRSLSDHHLSEIHDLTQDMWADTSSELVRCDDCGYISGKREIMGHLPTPLYRQKVSKILSRGLIDHMCCYQCHSYHTQLVNSLSSSLPTIRSRLHDSLESSTVMCRNQDDELVGYAEAYVSSFDRAYEWELAPHYPDISSEEMRTRVEKIIGREASPIIVFSVLGLTLEYRTPFLFARLLKTFFESTHFSHRESPGLMEIGKNNGIYKVFMGLGGRSLNDTDPAYFAQHLRASPQYNSTIAVFPITMSLFQNQFIKNSVREILQLA